MKLVRVTFTVEVEDHATPDQIDHMVWCAEVQLSEPQDEDGERANFGTSNVTTEWVEVAS